MKDYADRRLWACGRFLVFQVKTINCMRDKRIIEPALYLEASTKDKHRLIKWRMHWLPSYPIKTCRCGEANATREHYNNCFPLRPLLSKLIKAFGKIPVLQPPMQPLDYIINNLPRREKGLASVRWNKAWPELIRVLREIDYLSHDSEDFNIDDEPDPEESLPQIQNNTNA
ncbi:hypothetical protein BDC45DRAFT_530660 [Circinella umbellata]|nr:hypothetical protein BDC45DRAFT_530660 [Circinella umbellata]